MSESAWYEGREVVWKYTFRPIYKRFTVEKCVKVPGASNRLTAIKPRCGYCGCPSLEAAIRHNSLWLRERDDDPDPQHARREKAAELLRNYYKERATNSGSDQDSIQKFVDRIASISANRVIVYED